MVTCSWTQVGSHTAAGTSDSRYHAIMKESLKNQCHARHKETGAVTGPDPQSERLGGLRVRKE